MVTANRDASTISPKVVRDTPTETSLTPLRRGFFFSASHRIATPSSRSGRRRTPASVLQSAEKAVPGERFELPTNGLQKATIAFQSIAGRCKNRCAPPGMWPIFLAFALMSCYERCKG